MGGVEIGTGTLSQVTQPERDVSYIHRVTDGHEITSEERLLGSSTRKPKVTVFDGSLGKNSLFFPQGGGGGGAR